MSCNFSSLRFLTFIFLLSFRHFFWFPNSTIIGKWSLISSVRMKGLKFCCNFGLVKILSSNVAVVWVIRVGFVIQGVRSFDRFISRNSLVCLWLWVLSKSRLWSRPIINSWFLHFLRLAINLLYSDSIVLTLVLGGLYPDVNKIFLVSVLSSTTTCSRCCISTHKSA